MASPYGPWTLFPLCSGSACSAVCVWAKDRKSKKGEEEEEEEEEEDEAAAATDSAINLDVEVGWKHSRMEKDVHGLVVRGTHARWITKCYDC